MIKQDNFTIMKGHVCDGQKIKMNDGAVWTIKDHINGWYLVDDSGVLIVQSRDGQYIEYIIVNH